MLVSAIVPPWAQGVVALALLVLVFSLTALGEESTITTKNEENRYSMSFSFFPVMIRMR